MDDLAPITDLLAFQPMPKLAAALRERKERILARWNGLVKKLLPDADQMTTRQVRNSIPVILDRIANALAAADARPTDELMAATQSHGAVRFHESYNIRELVEEYRILRRILVEEMDAAYAGVVSTREWIALDIAVDISLQEAVVTFTEHQKSQLKSSTEAEAKYLAFVSHDMRNSLNGMLLAIEWVERSLGARLNMKEEVETLRGARQSALGTIQSMDRLLHAERLRKGVRLNRERVVLAKLADEVAQERVTDAIAKSIRVESKVPGEAVLQSDAGLLRVILKNLVENAVKYSERGAVTIDAVALEGGSGSAWRLRVTDDGMGIPEAKVEQLFEAFTRGETHGQPGVGLGLFMASQAARLLGSKLEVRSVVGKGSTFELVLRDLRVDADGASTHA
jgi:signal transduction histidine kinase